jgi:hypothetical protein
MIGCIVKVMSIFWQVGRRMLVVLVVTTLGRDNGSRMSVCRLGRMWLGMAAGGVEVFLRRGLAVIGVMRVMRHGVYWLHLVRLGRCIRHVVAIAVLCQAAVGATRVLLALGYVVTGRRSRRDLRDRSTGWKRFLPVSGRAQLAGASAHALQATGFGCAER